MCKRYVGIGSPCLMHLKAQKNLDRFPLTLTEKLPDSTNFTGKIQSSPSPNLLIIHFKQDHSTWSHMQSGDKVYWKRSTRKDWPCWQWGMARRRPGVHVPSISASTAIRSNLPSIGSIENSIIGAENSALVARPRNTTGIGYRWHAAAHHQYI
jgi:hypothetical protein